MDAVLDPGISKESGDELSGAVGLVAAGEAAGNHDDLRLLDPTGEFLHRLLNGAAGKVVDDENIGGRTRPLKGPLGVVFAVGAGKNGDQHPGRSHLDGRSRPVFCLVAVGRDLFITGGDVAAEHRLQLLLVGFLQFLKGQADGAVGGKDLRLQQGNAQNFIVVCLRTAGQFQNKAAVNGVKEQLVGELSCKLEAHPVAEGHLGHCFRHAAEAQRPCGNGFTGADHFLHPGEERSDAFKIRGAICVVSGGQQHHGGADLLEFGGDHRPGVAHGYSEGDQRGRNVDVLKGAGHGVLAADGGAP